VFRLNGRSELLPLPSLFLSVSSSSQALIGARSRSFSRTPYDTSIFETRRQFSSPASDRSLTAPTSSGAKRSSLAFVPCPHHHLSTFFFCRYVAFFFFFFVSPDPPNSTLQLGGNFLVRMHYLPSFLDFQKRSGCLGDQWMRTRRYSVPFFASPFPNCITY